MTDMTGKKIILTYATWLEVWIDPVLQIWFKIHSFFCFCYILIIHHWQTDIQTDKQTIIDSNPVLQFWFTIHYLLCFCCVLFKINHWSFRFALGRTWKWLKYLAIFLKHNVRLPMRDNAILREVWNERYFKNPCVNEQLIMKSSQHPALLTLTSPDPGRPTSDFISQPTLRWLTIRSDDRLYRKCFFHKQLSCMSTQTLGGLLISFLQTLWCVIVAVRAPLRSHYNTTDSWDLNDWLQRPVRPQSPSSMALFLLLHWSLVSFLSSTLRG